MTNLPPLDPPADARARQHLHQLLRTFDTVMLATFDRVAPEPHLRARPMSIARLHPDCSMSFFTHVGAGKVHEALAERTGHVLCQSRDLSINLGGSFSLTQDPAELQRLFQKKHAVWFPDGPDDETLCLLEFHPQEAEIWDMSGARGVRLLVGLAVRAVTGDDVDVRGGTHERMHW